MRKLLQTTLLALILSLVLLPTMAGAVDADSTALTGAETTLSGGTENAPVKYHLDGDLSINSTITVTGYVELDLNDHVLTMTGGRSVFQVGNDTPGSLTLKDSSSTAGTPHHFQKNSETNRWEKQDACAGDTCIHTVTGGYITGGSSPTGGGVYVKKGTFTLQSGSIIGCTSTAATDTNGGGGVHVDENSSFNMNGGTIADCHATGGSYGNGGGVFLHRLSTSGSATFTMTGGTIIDCSAEYNGGGVYVGAYGEFTMGESGSQASCSAKISACSAKNGGGVTGAQKAVLALYQGTIENCSAVNLGGGVFAYDDPCSGSTITGCSATYGGGIYLAHDNSIPLNLPPTLTNTTIKNCNAKTGGGVYLNTSARLTLSGSVTIQDCTAANTGNDAAGGGIFVDSNAALTMNEGSTLTVTGCSANGMNAGGTDQRACGGGIFVSSGTGLTMSEGSKLQLENCSATGDTGSAGGGLYLVGGSLTLNSGSYIKDCSTSGSGGGVYFNGTHTADTYELSADAQIISCTATRWGGGVYVANGKTFAMSGGTISGCKANYGGGVYVSKNATLEMNSGSKIDGGNTQTTSVTNASYSGGGVYVEPGAKLTMSEGSTIENCKATSNGGGVYVDVYSSEIGTFEMNGGTISGCKAKNGGGVYVSNNAKLEMNSGTISGCSATIGGGGLYFALSGNVIWGENSNVSITGCKATGSSGKGGGLYLGGTANTTLTIQKGTISGCEATNGGGVFVNGGSGLVLSYVSTAVYAVVEDCEATNGGGVYVDATGNSGKLTMDGGTISNCTATTSGGGVYVDYYSSSGNVYNGSFTMNSGTLSGCEAKSGGGVYLSNSAELTMNSGSTISGCKVTATGGSGGGVFVSSGATLTMNSGSKIENCTATNNGDGGGVYVVYTNTGNPGTLSMTGATISRCSAANSGGGIYNSGTLTMNSGNTISGCSAKNGGGIYSTSSFTMSSGCTISGCSATNNGGGINISGGAALTMNSGSKIENCTANSTSGGGGGVYVSTGATFTMNSGSTIENCTANSTSGGGGGVYVSTGATFTMNSGSTITGCSATNDGGGVYVYGVSGSNGYYGTFTMNGAAITGCSASVSGGGVSITNHAIFTMQNGAAISGCTATTSGGGIYSSGILTITDSAIYGVSDDVQPILNASSGGGIFCAATLNMTNSTVSGCKANNGGGITVNTNTGSAIVRNSTISGCTATEKGGGVNVSVPACKFTMIGGAISGCSVTGRGGIGGGIYFNGSRDAGNAYPYELSDDAQIINCSATGSDAKGGGIYIESGKTFKMTNSTISGCSASNGGGGVYSSGSFSMTSSAIYGASDDVQPASNAANGGGVYVGGGSTTITGSIISGCKVSANGGGVFIGSGYTVSMANSTISDCSATGDGGGVYVAGSAAKLTMNSGSTISGCEATYGGGVYVKVTGTLSVNGANTTINGNKNSNVFLVKNTSTGAFAAIAEGTDNAAKNSEVYVTLGDTDNAENLRFIGSLTLGTSGTSGTGYGWDRPVLTFSRSVLADTVTINEVTVNPDIKTGGNYVFVNQLISNVTSPVRVFDNSYLTALKGITAAGLTVRSGATVTAQGGKLEGDTSVDSWGVYLTGDDAELLIESGGTLTASGSFASQYSKHANSAGVYMTGSSAKVMVKGTLTASGGEAVASDSSCRGTSAGIHLTGESASVSVEGGTLNATSRKAGNNEEDAMVDNAGTSAGIYLTGADSSVTLKGGRLTATGGAIRRGGDSDKSYGVRAAKLTLDKSETAAGSFNANSTWTNGIAVYLTAADVPPTLHADATITTPEGGVVGSVGSPAYYTIKAPEADVGAQTVTVSISGPAVSPDPTPDPRPTGGGGSSTYPVTVPASFENGSVTVSPTRASAGSTITITVTPNSGYTLETLTVLDKNGNELTLTDLGGGKYSFKMPSGTAKLTASFMEDNSMLNFFVDVPASQYYYEAVKWAVANGITTGIGDNRFGPDLTCTRAQIVTFLYRCAIAMGVDVTVGEDTNILSYTDALTVPGFAVEAFQWAVGAGILQGSDGSLMPNDDCTRGQIVTMLHRFTAAIGGSTGDGESTNILSYNDALTVPDFAFAPFQWAVGAGVIQGYDGSLMPNDTCTRGQIVTMLYRAYA